MWAARTADKAMVLVVAEEGGRVRLIHTPGNHEDCIKHVVDEQIEADAAVKTDGHAAYNARTLEARDLDAKAQPKRRATIMSSFATGRQPTSSAGYLAPITAPSATSICSPTLMSMPFAIIAGRPRALATSLRAVLKTWTHDSRSPRANSFETPMNAERSKALPIEPD
jgi:hypothetical protein